MREIKLNAWDTHLSTMVKDIHLLDSCNEYLTRERYIILQYIGLKDNEEIEIFEGDILEGIDPLEPDVKVHIKIYWKTPGYMKRYISSNVSKEDADLLDDIDEGDLIYYEVIGNIHENPELITDLNRETVCE